MTWAIFAVLFGCLIAYASNRVALRTVSVGILVSLALIYAFAHLPDGGSIPVDRVFVGFASGALVTIVCLMMLGHVLMTSGALRPLAALLSRAFAVSPRLAFAGLLLTGFLASGFVNDTPVVVLLLPTVMAAAAHGGMTPGTMLMPMNFAVILGGMMTAIGTSTNLLVNSISSSNGGPSFGFFAFYPVALPAALAGLLYLYFVAPVVLRSGLAPETAGKAPPREFLRSMRIAPGSPADGRALFAAARRLGPGVRVRRLVRRGRQISLLPTVTLRAADLLVVSGPSDAIELAAIALGVVDAEREEKREKDAARDAARAQQAQRAQQARQAERAPVAGDALPAAALAESAATAKAADKVETARDKADETAMRGEYIVVQGSTLEGRTLKEAAFETHFELKVVGLADVRRADLDAASADLRFIPIAAGDILLLEGTAQALARAQDWAGLLPVKEPARHATRAQAAMTVLVFAVVIVLAVAKVVPISVAALGGVLACVLGGLATWDELERAINWRIILIVASAIALGDALILTGAMQSTATALGAAMSGLPGWVGVAMIVTAAGLLTNFVSNNAAAAILTPLAIEVSRATGIPAEPMVLAVLFGANLCFLTPFAYQTNLLVMAAAKYRFVDFVKVGLPLFVLVVPVLVASLWWHFLR
ncbi:MAG: SLC13 family permease [Lautropia sp.]